MKRREGENNPPETDVLLVGEIGRPHGIKGEVKIYPHSGNPDSLKSYEEVLVRHPRRATEEMFHVNSCRSQGKFAVVKFEGVDSRDAAECLTGGGVFVERRAMPELPKDEFYWHDLQGMIVLTRSGRRLGTVVRLLATGAHDLLVVADKGREYLIPALDEFITAIDAERRTITVDPPEGLLEINN